MGGSRLRPFLFVGLAYFVIAVALPLMLQNYLPADPGQWNLTGILWSLAAGAAGEVSNNSAYANMMGGMLVRFASISVRVENNRLEQNQGAGLRFNTSYRASRRSKHILFLLEDQNYAAIIDRTALMHSAVAA